MSYENYERAQGWSEQDFGAFSDSQSAWFEAEVLATLAPATGSVRVLDIGFGNGSFMGWARSRGWTCEGIELNSRLIERAALQGFNAAGSLEEVSNMSGWQPYDLITGFDVLEHIDRDALVPFLTSLRTVCSSQTLLLFRFPNGDNPFSAPVQNGDLTHRTAIGQSMLRQIAELSEFDVVRLGGPKPALRGAGWSKQVGARLGGPVRRLLGMFLRQLFMGGMPVVFTGNLVAVLKLRRSQCQSV